MIANRQLWSRLVVADVVLFVIASALNDHSLTSIDGIIWWLALALFALLIAAGSAIMIGYVRSRASRRRRRRRSR
jgi:hypothetical protein